MTTNVSPNVSPNTIPIVTSRFNNATWFENCEYRMKYTNDACIYGAPLQMSSKIFANSLVFVVEMNNSKNKIEGIGLIRNHISHDKYYKVYQTGNYNRYIYKGDLRIDRASLEEYCPQLVSILDHILFKEKTHLKRGSGFTMIPDKLLYHKKCTSIGLNIKQELKIIFQRHFPSCNTDKDIETDSIAK